jgi:hypothetical protein
VIWPSLAPDEGDSPDGTVAFGYLNRPPVPTDSAALFQIADDLEGGCASCLIIDQLGAVWVIVVMAVSDLRSDKAACHGGNGTRLFCRPVTRLTFEGRSTVWSDKPAQSLLTCLNVPFDMPKYFHVAGKASMVFAIPRQRPCDRRRWTERRARAPA